MCVPGGTVPPPGAVALHGVRGIGGAKRPRCALSEDCTRRQANAGDERQVQRRPQRRVPYTQSREAAPPPTECGPTACCTMAAPFHEVPGQLQPTDCPAPLSAGHSPQHMQADEQLQRRQRQPPEALTLRGSQDGPLQALDPSLPPQSLLLRLVDDVLILTTSRSAAEAAARRLVAGFPE
jgi:hypothetical protein